MNHTRNNIKEIEESPVATHKAYKERPCDAQLEAICRLSFQLGYENARLSIFESRRMTREADERGE